jgi:hypothetical protein
MAAADAGTCPRCDAPRTLGQRYCIDCGLRLPAAEGATARLRGTWLRVFGWYPGDWIWPALGALAIAAAGTAGAIAIAERGDAGGTTFAATAGEAPTPSALAGTTSLPGPVPAPPARRPPNGRTEWPAGQNGWTVVLISLPRAVGAEKAAQRALRAAKTGLPDAGYLVSDRFPSLHPGYFVVFAGIYGTRAEAEAAVPTARAKGFAGAYARPVAN